jgi:hypothetical protein
VALKGRANGLLIGASDTQDSGIDVLLHFMDGHHGLPGGGRHESFTEHFVGRNPAGIPVTPGCLFRRSGSSSRPVRTTN